MLGTIPRREIVMDETHRLTHLLISCFVVSAPTQEKPLRLPTSHGVLDHAMKRLKDSTFLPQWAKDHIHFADGRTGLICLELSEILAWAQHAKLTQEPNPTYRYTEVLVDRGFATRRLEKLGIPLDDARQLGSLLWQGFNDQSLPAAAAAQ